jgi:hypothetical protein
MKMSAYRIPVDIRADIILDNLNYEVQIINLSADGACIENDSLLNKIELTVGMLMRLEFHTPKEDEINMESKIIWSRNFEPDDEIYSVGMQFIDKPPEYDEFFHNLYIRDMRVM